eukprot:COSAG06_NODE_23884_length_678_cov_363.409326_1_plen_71_part_10
MPIQPQVVRPLLSHDRDGWSEAAAVLGCSAVRASSIEVILGAPPLTGSGPVLRRQHGTQKDPPLPALLLLL